MKGTVMFASLLVTGESLTCTGSDDPSASVPFCYSGSDLGETVDVKVDSFGSEADHRRDGEWPRKYLLFGEVIHQEWAGSHGGLERLRERRADQFPPVLFGPR